MQYEKLRFTSLANSCTVCARFITVFYAVVLKTRQKNIILTNIRFRVNIMSVKKIFKTCLITAASALVTLGAAEAQNKKLFIFNFSNYFADDTISNFIKQSGIDTKLDYFDTHEMLETRLITGGSGYDVAFASSPVASRLIPANALQKLDKSKLKNYGNIDPFYLEMISTFDPGNEYMVPYMITTTGIAYNVKKINERMPDAPVDSLDMFFKPEIAEKFTNCGIGINDSPNEIIPIALNYLGLDPYSTNKEDLAKAKDLLMKLRPYIRHMRTGQLLDDMASGELCLALMWNGDANIGAQRAKEANAGVEVIYRLPKEGTSITLDNMVIPVDAPDPEEALKFIDYIMEPKVTADITNAVFFPNPNTAATPFVASDIRDNPNLYPPEELRKKLFVDKLLSPRDARERTRLWTAFRAGK